MEKNHLSPDIQTTDNPLKGAKKGYVNNEILATQAATKEEQLRSDGASSEEASLAAEELIREALGRKVEKGPFYYLRYLGDESKISSYLSEDSSPGAGEIAQRQYDNLLTELKTNDTQAVSEQDNYEEWLNEAAVNRVVVNQGIDAGRIRDADFAQYLAHIEDHFRTPKSILIKLFYNVADKIYQIENGKEYKVLDRITDLLIEQEIERQAELLGLEDTLEPIKIYRAWLTRVPLSNNY